MKHSADGPTSNHSTDAGWTEGGFGIYIHWPYCQSKCPYCDFNSHVAQKVDQNDWREAYLIELDRLALETGDRLVDSVFFGGGTPSLMQAETVSAILGRVRNLWTPRNSMEVTLEANPSSAEAGRFAGYHDAGVNRVSIGAQSLNDKALRELGRLHSAEEARAAINLAQNIFPQVSLDLIYARQSQTPGQWEQELREAIAIGTDHLSLYQLTVEPGTPFQKRHAAGKLRGLPSENRAVALFQMTQRICEDAGFESYEVSNHARLNAQSVHNRIYWQAGDYLGVGPGAHGRISVGGTRLATEAESEPKSWLEMVRNGKGVETRTQLSSTEQADEYLLMGLRMRTGIRVDRLQKMLGSEIDLTRLKRLEEIGVIEFDAQTIRATAAGRLVLNSLISEVSAALN